MFGTFLINPFSYRYRYAFLFSLLLLFDCLVGRIKEVAVVVVDVE